MTTDQRLIEDYLPIEAISAEAKREKSIRKGHISMLHLWWARRPLVACWAAVYGALVPAPATPRARRERARFVAELDNHYGPSDKRWSGRSRHTADDVPPCRAGWPTKTTMMKEKTT
jgi:adenine-specific DNA methylase